MFEELTSGHEGNGAIFYLVARRLKAMADPARVRILHSLCSGERNVTQLVQGTGLSQAAVSKHLAILRGEGLVEGRRERKNVFYSLTSELSREICERICSSLEQDRLREERLFEGGKDVGR